MESEKRKFAEIVENIYQNYEKVSRKQEKIEAVKETIKKWSNTPGTVRFITGEAISAIPTIMADSEADVKLFEIVRWIFNDCNILSTELVFTTEDLEKSNYCHYVVNRYSEKALSLNLEFVGKVYDDEHDKEKYYFKLGKNTIHHISGKINVYIYLSVTIAD